MSLTGSNGKIHTYTQLITLFESCLLDICSYWSLLGIRNIKLKGNTAPACGKSCFPKIAVTAPSNFHSLLTVILIFLPLEGRVYVSFQ